MWNEHHLGDPKMTYSHWSPGQGPSQSGFFFANGAQEDCALMQIHDGFRWHDYECSFFLYHYSFICQHGKVVVDRIMKCKLIFIFSKY